MFIKCAYQELILDIKGDHVLFSAPLNLFFIP